jgi:hypothetical protein
MEMVLLGLRILAAVVLYAFLAAILGMLRRDLRSTDETKDVAQRSARLVVVETEGGVFGAGTTFVLELVTSVGRGPGNTISVPDSFASTRHALIAWRGSQWWVEDQGSRNGTLLNGVAVGRPTVIAAGDIVAVGRTAFRLERDDGPGT